MNSETRQNRHHLQGALVAVIEENELNVQRQALAASTLTAACNLDDERANLLMARALELIDVGLGGSLEMTLTSFALERGREAADWREGWIIGAHFLACLGSHSTQPQVRLLATTAALCATDDRVSAQAAFVAALTALAMIVQGFDELRGEELLVSFANQVFPHLGSEDDQIGIARTLVAQVDEHCHPDQPCVDESAADAAVEREFACK
jgi:hypothetical protein